MSKINCHECKHVVNCPGDAHKSCSLANKILNVKPENKHIVIISFLQLHPKKVNDVFKNFNINYPEYAINKGWFFWPINYDPVWLTTCNKFEQK